MPRTYRAWVVARLLPFLPKRSLQSCRQSLPLPKAAAASSANDKSSISSNQFMNIRTSKSEREVGEIRRAGTMMDDSFEAGIIPSVPDSSRANTRDWLSASAANHALSLVEYKP
jgi:hypothetical protein